MRPDVLPTPERISIELTNKCGKKCPFCYNKSHPDGAVAWAFDELLHFVRDCAARGTKAFSFGGGEPLESDLLFPILKATQGQFFRSLTSNGLLLDEAMIRRLVEAKPDKVHVSIHFPGLESEVARVADRVKALEQAGIRSGINLLVARSKLAQARGVARRLADEAIGPERIIFLPQRGHDTPSPREIAEVAGKARFQSMACLVKCGKSPRFASVGWDKQVAWCSYTVSRRAMLEINANGLMAALKDLPVTYCGGGDGSEI
ncbi:radical SAM protein [Methylovirgula sp. 4M-Z18]|uniref:radical SAM protein n=1 Tax=Methylovirgula sp. 4M-Z18 TaxID=2293567 RepID=UPI000E2F0AA7|nr:radical SAM protein [Methylovirgula sp. 4M-Z18]RFB78878.1 radical SAM protein [Methylovirgula sp. 4M-Z18]